MKKLLFLRSMSRAVHEEHHNQEYKTDGACTTLTVWRKSLLLSCNGFTVIDSNGNLVYRVDNYIGSRPEEIVLMDGSGKPLLSMRQRKKLGIVDNWLVYEGEVGNCCRNGGSSKKPVCCVTRHIDFLHSNPNVLAHVFRDKRAAYVIEGSYALRSCKVLDKSRRRVVAEIRMKEAGHGGVSFGMDVFLLMVQPGFDPAFAMAIVLLLDQMFS